MPLGVLNNNITAAEAFGSSSVLVEQSFSGSAVDLALFGTPFQVTALIVGLVYTFFIVRYWDFLCYFIINTVGFRMPNRDKTHINPAEQRNIEVVTIILGVILLALSAVRICGLWFPQLLDGIDAQDVIWIVGGIVAVALSVVIAFQYGMTLLVAAVCQRPDIGSGIVETKLLYMAVGFVTVIPFGLLFLLMPQSVATVGMYGAIVCISIATIIFIKESFLFFVSQKISILHWFLYLCALEIFPLSLIFAPILR
jgi:hypothetical protein